MAIDSLDALNWLRNHLEQDNPDLVRDMVKAFAEALMGAARPTPFAGPATGSGPLSG